MVGRNAGDVVVLRSRPVRPRRAPAWDLSRLAEIALYGDEFAFNTVTGMLHRVSRTGGIILRELKAGRNFEEVIAGLQALYGVSQSRAERDIELFLSDLATLGLIDLRLGSGPREEVEA